MVFLVPQQSKDEIVGLRERQIKARAEGNVHMDQAFGDAIDAELDDLNLINGRTAPSTLAMINR